MARITAKEVRESNLKERRRLAAKVKQNEIKKIQKITEKMLKKKTWEQKIGETVSVQMQDYANEMGYVIKKYGKIYYLQVPMCDEQK